MPSCLDFYIHPSLAQAADRRVNFQSNEFIELRFLLIPDFFFVAYPLTLSFKTSILMKPMGEESRDVSMFYVVYGPLMSSLSILDYLSTVYQSIFSKDNNIKYLRL